MGHLPGGKKNHKAGVETLGKTATGARRNSSQFGVAAHYHRTVIGDDRCRAGVLEVGTGDGRSKAGGASRFRKRRCSGPTNAPESMVPSNEREACRLCRGA